MHFRHAVPRHDQGSANLPLAKRLHPNAAYHGTHIGHISWRAAFPPGCTQPFRPSRYEYLAAGVRLFASSQFGCIPFTRCLRTDRDTKSISVVPLIQRIPRQPTPYNVITNLIGRHDSWQTRSQAAEVTRRFDILQSTRTHICRTKISHLTSRQFNAQNISRFLQGACAMANTSETHQNSHISSFSRSSLVLIPDFLRRSMTGS